jgi:uncharacterized Zn finger protein
MGWGYGDWRPYVPVAQRLAQGRREAARRAKKGGRTLAPVTTPGRQVAATFWGKGWCDHLEGLGDYANRLPRGRTYVRNGSVVDLRIEPGKVVALVAGSELYDVTVSIRRLDAKRWRAVTAACAGRIGSLIGLLQGKLSPEVIAVLTDGKSGLFPAPREIDFHCSCPDWASMCKHVAAALYGVGARLDEQPELFFTLRQVDQADLLSRAATPATLPSGAKGKKRIAADKLATIFGIELADTPAVSPAPRATRKRR